MELPYDFAQPVHILKQVINEHTLDDYSVDTMIIRYNDVELNDDKTVGDYVSSDAPQPVKLYVSEPVEIQQMHLNFDHQKAAAEMDRDTRKMIENLIKSKDLQLSD